VQAASDLRVATAALVGHRVLMVETLGSRALILPKGKIDLGETPRDAAARELAEEGALLRTSYFSPEPIARYVHARSRSGRTETHDVYLALARPRDFDPTRDPEGRNPRCLTLADALDAIVVDVAAGRRSARSGAELAAALHRAFVCARGL
jgi:8-oxo-dGTP pyrophosphatase MutT (NUDIX family)